MNVKQHWTASRMGKLIGAALGFIMAGPTGAFLGLMIGHFFDKNLEAHLHSSFSETYAHQEGALQVAFIQSLFFSMGYVMKAEGHITPAMIQQAQAVIHALHLDLAHTKLAQSSFQLGKSASHSQLNTELQHFTHHMPHRALLQQWANLLYETLEASTLSSKKIKRFNQVLQQIGFKPLDEQEKFYKHRTSHAPSYQDTLDSAYALLNVGKDQTQSDIRRAYRRQLSAHHPDRVIARGGSEREIKQANERTQKIKEAYQHICQAKGWTMR